MASIDELSMGKAWYRSRKKAFLVLQIVSDVILIGAISAQIQGTCDVWVTVQAALGCLVLLIFFIKTTYDSQNILMVIQRGFKVAAVLSKTNADFVPTNEYAIPFERKLSLKVWINKETGQIQFLLPDASTAKKKPELRKTKVVQLSSLLGCDLNFSTTMVESIVGYSLNPLQGNTALMGRVERTSHSIGRYYVVFTFDDVDLSYVNLSFGDDSEGAKKLYYSIKALIRAHAANQSN